MSVSLPPDKLVDIQKLASAMLQMHPVTFHQVMSFLGMANFLCQRPLSTVAVVLSHSE